jgi:hypothetical protein
VSAPERELTLPELLDALPESERLDVIELDADLRAQFQGKGRQLASELLGPYQQPRRVNAKTRRRAKRVAALNHDTTRDVVLNGRNVGSVTVDEMPLGGPVHAPKWLRRSPRLTDGQQHEVVRYQMVDGERVRVTATEQERSQKAEAMLRRQAYQLDAGNDPSSIQVVHYQESDADHRPRNARLDAGTARAAVKRGMVKAYGDVCATCGLNHKGTC